MPLSVPFGEVLGYNMARNACEGDVALSPLLETKVESVILDPLNAANIVLDPVSLPSHLCRPRMDIFYAQQSLCRPGGWQPPLRLKASPLRTAPSSCWRSAAVIKLAGEQW
jgi:hypothetical protein